MNIDQIISDIIRREGGFVNHPNDKGGPTKYGITKHALAEYFNRDIADITIEDVRGVTKELAADIYEEKYWRKPKIDRLPKQVQPFLLDSSVNHGPDDPILFVQRVCNGAEIADLAIDGVAGPATRKAAHDAQEIMGDWFLKALIEERSNYYKRIVAEDATQAVFLEGWLARLTEFG